MGTSGNRARRPTNNTTRKLDPDHYMVTAPEWVKKLRPIPARLNAPATMELFYDSSGSGESNDEDTTE
jgi:hypothetical protein